MNKPVNERTYGAFVLSVLLPRDPMFRAFLGYFMVPARDDVTVDEAAEFIKAKVGIESRNELKTDRRAQQRFHEVLMKPYAAWKERQLETTGDSNDVQIIR